MDSVQEESCARFILDHTCAARRQIDWNRL